MSIAKQRLRSRSSKDWINGLTESKTSRLYKSADVNPYFPNKLHKLELVKYNKAA